MQPRRLVINEVIFRTQSSHSLNEIAEEESEGPNTASVTSSATPPSVEHHRAHHDRSADGSDDLDPEVPKAASVASSSAIEPSVEQQTHYDRRSTPSDVEAQSSPSGTLSPRSKQGKEWRGGWDVRTRFEDLRSRFEVPFSSTSRFDDLGIRFDDLGSRFDDLKQRCAPLRSRVRLWYKQKFQPFWKLALAQAACVIYILVLTFSNPPVGIKDPVTKNIIDPTSAENTDNGVIYVNGSYRPVVAEGGWQKFCLAMSRMSAFSMYPMIVVVFLTKMKAIQSFLSKTPLSVYFGVINQTHDFHVKAGRYIAFDVWVHTFFHIIRWASQGNMKLLSTSAAGITGLITVLVTPLITFPMMYCKRKIRYEIRKALHYLFYVFAVAMCFHVPMTAIPNGGFILPVLGSCIVLYTLDACYVYLFLCEKIETTAFYVLSSGVRISMPVSERFQKQPGARGGYAYIMIPWIDDMQWHAFSLFQDPSDPQTQQMFLLKCGDWTKAVHSALSRDTTRPCWIKGPFPSPYSHAVSYDNQILVASGIGITPALAAINAFKSIRRVNLIWACRDPEMLEFFLEHMYLDHDGWNLIFYTGKKPLSSSVESFNTNIRVIKGRPDLASVIPNIIYGIESKEGLPENYTKTSKVEMKKLLMEQMLELENDSSMSARQKVAKLEQFGEIHGFDLHEMIGELSEIEDSFREYDSAREGDDDAARNMLRELKSSSAAVSFRSLLDLGEEDGGCNLPPKSRRGTVERFVSELATSSDHADASLRSQGKEQQDEVFQRPALRRQSYKQWNRLSNLVETKDSVELLSPGFQPWKKSVSQEKCCKRFSEDVLSTWGIMYCGGSKPVISALREISIEYSVDLHIDSFAW